MTKRILYEDNHLIIINKMPGEIVQGDKTGDVPLSDHVKEYLKERYGKPGNVFLGVIHRIDRPSSGAVIFARTSKSLTRMNLLFRNNKVDKFYWAVVCNRPEKAQDTLEHFLVHDTTRNKSFVTGPKRTGARQAKLTYALIAESERYFLLEVSMQTGRHHQIRAQLAHIGCPIKGDLKYGAARSNEDGGIHLHARGVSFEHPTREEVVKVTASVPEDGLWAVFERMAESAG